MTVRTPTEAEKRRAELIAQGILPDLAPDKRPKKTGA